MKGTLAWWVTVLLSWSRLSLTIDRWINGCCTSCTTSTKRADPLTTSTYSARSSSRCSTSQAGLSLRISRWSRIRCTMTMLGVLVDAVLYAYSTRWVEIHLKYFVLTRAQYRPSTHSLRLSPLLLPTCLKRYIDTASRVVRVFSQQNGNLLVWHTKRLSSLPP